MAVTGGEGRGETTPVAVRVAMGGGEEGATVLPTTGR